jgi:hypothetical protein
MVGFASRDTGSHQAQGRTMFDDIHAASWWPNGRSSVGIEDIY